MRWPVVQVTCCAFLLVVVENYLMHHNWTFRSVAPHGQAPLGFLSLSLLGFCVNGAVMSDGAKRYGFNHLAVQAVAIAIVVPCNFLALT